MRVGVMLRHYNQHGGGVRVYTHALLQNWATHPGGHEYVLFYNDPALLGTFQGRAHITEVYVPGRQVLAWDQIGLPRALRRHGVDVLFNPKYSLPLCGEEPAAWVCHGLDWYVMPWASRFRDRLSHRFLVPKYARRARAIIAVSEVTREHLTQFLNVPPERIVTVYTGVDDIFRTVPAEDALEEARRRYQLPANFLLYVGAIYPPKNFTRLIQAYACIGPKLGLPLVIAGGENRFLSEVELMEPARLGIEKWIRWLGWVENADVALLYRLAQALLLPSLFESFGIPIVEAMASGCPVVTANCYGSKEIAGDAAELVDPRSVESIAVGIERVLLRPELRSTLIQRGRARSSTFTWDRCAGQTLRALERIATAD
jgi:glycosyltransferase involved in cell wall biosynthesis